MKRSVFNAIHLLLLASALSGCASAVAPRAAAGPTPETRGRASTPSTPSPLVVPIDAATRARLPRERMKASAHGKALDCEGVPLVALLRDAGAMPDTKLPGAMLSRYVLVDARDGYRVLYSLAELDPHTGALVVTIGTLVIQGFTLGRVANLMKLRAPDPREDALARAQVMQASVDAGEAAMRKALADDPELADTPEAIIKSLQKQGMRRANLQWELLGNNDTMGPTQQYRILRQKMIDAEREKALEMRNEGRVDHEVIDSIMMQLDIEESMILTAEDRDAVLGETRPLLTPEGRRGDCEHLVEAADSSAAPQSHEGSQTCLEQGMKWLHLRMCTECGYVGCCDSSAGQHATKHFRATGHPVMRSFEPGEAWRWCFVDGLPG